MYNIFACIMYAYVCVQTFVYIIYINVGTYVYMCMYVCILLYTLYMWVGHNIYVYVHVCIHLYVYVYTFEYIIYMYMCVYLCVTYICLYNTYN